MSGPQHMRRTAGGRGRRGVAGGAALALCFAAAVQSAAGQAAAEPPTAPASQRLDVTAPAVTDRGSVTLIGKAWEESRVLVEGGIVPVSVQTDRDGSFTAEVLLRPGE